MELGNVPRILDVDTMLALIRGTGADADWTGPNEVRVDASGLTTTELDEELCNQIRASILLAGPLLARFGTATVPPPGGDVIGRRRIDTHIHALAALGAEIETGPTYEMRAERLRGTTLFLDEASVTGTENAVMASVLAEGRPPFATLPVSRTCKDLCRFLVTLGAHIDGIGSNVLRIRGVESLGGGSHRICPEHIEVASFIGLAAVTGSAITIEGAQPDDLLAILPAFERLGEWSN